MTSVSSCISATATTSVATTDNKDRSIDDVGNNVKTTISSNTTTGNCSSTVSDDVTDSNFVRDNVEKEISKFVLRGKLQKLRHLVLESVISKDYLDSLFPELLKHFDPQTVYYNGGIANIKEWKISCYLEVMDGGIPCTNPNTTLLRLFNPLLEKCNELFLFWYRQQHSCNNPTRKSNEFSKLINNKRSVLANKNDNATTAAVDSATVKASSASITREGTTANNDSNNNKKDMKTKLTCRRVMTFITRYTPAPDEQALLKHVDGAGKVDGSIVVALPIDRWSATEEENSFIGHGGGITFWDGKKDPKTKQQQQQIHYETRSGDIAFIDRAVWHQADPITKGTRWALVIFYEVQNVPDDDDRNDDGKQK